ncbi:hypothetical protein BLA34_23140 [Ralstonia solanacearum]|nr:hypothetical protein BLA34_23140 [Ralstonia solanacearum]
MLRWTLTILVIVALTIILAGLIASQLNVSARDWGFDDPDEEENLKPRSKLLDFLQSPAVAIGAVVVATIALIAIRTLNR